MNLTSSRIWVTGGNGFVGRHLISKLKKLGCERIYSPRSYEVDLLYRKDITRALKEFEPDIVIHLAASVGGIGVNREHPADFFYNNIMMGVPLMHECCLAKVKKFVAVGTICSYPKFTPIPFCEDNIWNGYPEETNAPYGLAKKMLLVQAQAYRQQYGFNAIFLLPVNLYGPGDNFDLESSHVIPALIRKFIEAKESGKDEVVCWGNGLSTREFLYVDDAVDGLILAAERYDGNEPINLGSGKDIFIVELADLISKEVGFSGKIVWDLSKPNGQPRRCLDVYRAEKLFGFKSKTDFKAGIRNTIIWYLENRKQFEDSNYSLE